MALFQNVQGLHKEKYIAEKIFPLFTGFKITKKPIKTSSQTNTNNMELHEEISAIHKHFQYSIECGIKLLDKENCTDPINNWLFEAKSKAKKHDEIAKSSLSNSPPVRLKRLLGHTNSLKNLARKMKNLNANPKIEIEIAIELCINNYKKKLEALIVEQQPKPNCGHKLSILKQELKEVRTGINRNDIEILKFRRSNEDLRYREERLQEKL